MISASSIKIKDSTIYRNLLDIFYPIGSVYISTVNTNPASFLGGTWVAISSENAVLRASNTFSLTGSDVCTLTTNQIPSHAHLAPSHAHGVGTLSTNSAGKHAHSLNVRSRATGFAGNALTLGNLDYNYTTNINNQNNMVSNGSHSHTISGTTANGGNTNTGNTGGGLHTQLFNVLSIALCGDELLSQEGDALWL